MNGIDAILYINLEHRTDRNQHILSEIHKVCDDITKIHRIDAIKRTPGALGCGLSHIKAMNYALDHPEWKTVLILEDDFTFCITSSEMINEYLSLLLSQLGDRGCSLLSTNSEYLKTVNTHHPKLKRVLFSQTASGYIIRRSYLPILLQNMKEAMYDMERFGMCHGNCIDIYWNKLQLCDEWYITYPPLGYQYISYSDIQQDVTFYGY